MINWTARLLVYGIFSLQLVASLAALLVLVLHGVGAIQLPDPALMKRIKPF